MSKVKIKKIDPQGRVTLPSKWRKEKAASGRVYLMEHLDRLEIVSVEDVDLTEFFDSIDVDFEILPDYHRLKKKLLEAGI